MAESELERLRTLRRRVEYLNRTVLDDYYAFYDRNHAAFYRLPSQPPTTTTPISVTTSATALMTLSLNRVANKFVVDDDGNTLNLPKLFKQLLDCEWKSAELPQNNAFTTALIVRAAGRLAEGDVVDSATLLSLKRHNTNASDAKSWQKFNRKTISEIIDLVLSEVPDSLSVFEYSAASPIAYWFLDGAINLDIEASKLKGIAQLFANKFVRQVSLISAGHSALMDPIALAMSAAGCKRIGDFAPELRADVEMFPTEEELRYSIHLFFERQNEAGAWEKYFPMFHYPSVGSNHCWHVEALESLIREFQDIPDNNDLLGLLEKSVSWLETNQVAWNQDGKSFSGWNSGGQLNSLTRGEPESWATGVVHMFLCTLRKSISRTIRLRILKNRGIATAPTPNQGPWDELLQSQIKIKGYGGEDPQSLKDAVWNLTIRPILDAEVKSNVNLVPKLVKRSALIFGPPGTGKTRFVRALAAAIGWDFLEIVPSDFVDDGLERVYSKANRLFEDLNDLERAVVFFDEMDAMLQRRVDDTGQQQLSVEQQFMTTSMLPHLAQLYDGRKVLFFFATNHQSSFDDAITRAGRFDMMLFMGPPTWTEKANNVGIFTKLEDGDREKDVSKQLLGWIPPSHGLNDSLTRATFAETKAMFRDICQEKKLDVLIDGSDLDETGFLDSVKEWAENEFSLATEGVLKEQYDREKDLSEVR